jgi:type IV pilus assembly protein PilA
MIVVAVIGILAAIGIPQLVQYRVKSFNATGVSEIKNFKTTLEAYYSDHYEYPHF